VELNKICSTFCSKLNDSKYLQSFKDAEIESYLRSTENVAKFYDEINYLTEDVKFINELESIFRKRNVDIYSEKGSLTLILLIHNTLNGKGLTISESDQIIYPILNDLKKNKDQKEWIFEKEIVEIINQYDTSYNIGDDITLFFPLEIKNKEQYINAFQNPYPATLNYSHADDSLKVSGIVVNKRNIISIKDIELDIKILDKNFLKATIYNEEYNILDTISISIREFGRPPKKI
jgi:hypothetical protein